jgi:predicted metal-binding protein
MTNRSISPAAVWRTRSRPACKVTGRLAWPSPCLAVCKRPCTVAFSGADKWTYLIGDLDPESHVDEIVSAAKSFAASENGIVPWRERPASFRKGVIARVPPINHKEKQ